MLESGSAEARRALSLATGEARRLHHPHIGTEHLLLGLLGARGTRAASALGATGVRLTAARQKVTEANAAVSDTPPTDELPYSPRAQRALDRATRFARQASAADTGTAHLLLGVLDVEGLACQVLRGLGADPGRIRDDLLGQPVEETPAPDGAASTTVVPPCCPTCAAPLEGSLAITPVAAQHTDAPTGRTIPVVHCATCGTALGVLPAPG